MSVTTTQAQSVSDLIDLIRNQFAESGIFYGHGTDNANDEAAYLVLGALALPFDLSGEMLNQPVAPGLARDISVLAEQRVRKRTPVAYLINQAWFAGSRFYVDERVLIPRSPIAELIDEQFSPWVDAENIRTVLDIGTGSGCIAIACALAFPEASVDAIDVSEDALQVAMKNVETYELADRVRLLQSDLFQNLRGRQYDLIIANPPYVDAAEMASLPDEYRHEPAIALAAGTDGLDVVRRILKESRDHLSDNGVLIVEVGSSQGAVAEAFPELPFIWLDFEHGGEGVFLLTADDLLHTAGVTARNKLIE